MALPVILVNSATGSDSLASGAGPGTAVTGTAASVGATATSVTITDAVNLSGVATDGSAVLYCADGTAGHRNFDNITAIAGSSGAWTVTVTNGFSTTTGPFSWAIGGVRASIGSTTSTKLFSNNAAAGDAMPGWAVEMQSGHSETIAATYTMRRAGDTTNGVITLRGTSGAATRPLLTFSNNGAAINPVVNYIHLKDFELRNSNATKTASYGIQTGSGASYCQIRNVKIADSTNNFWRGFSPGVDSVAMEDSEIAHCADAGVAVISSIGVHLINCWIHNNGSHGISITAASNLGIEVIDCIVASNGGSGLSDAGTGLYTSNWQPYVVLGNTFDSNTADGITVSGAITARAFGGSRYLNNILSNNGGYGMNFSGASISDITLMAGMCRIRNNAFYNNTSGDTNPSGLSTNENPTSGVNPSYTNAAGGDYSIGTGLKAKGYPLGGTLTVGTTSATNSYVDPGAAQRQEPSSSGGGRAPGVIIPNTWTYED